MLKSKKASPERKTGLLNGWAFYGVMFLSAKALAFLGPLFVANVSNAEVYGAIELAFSYGLLLGPLLMFGVAIAAPQHMLMEENQAVIDLVAFSVIGAAIFGFIIAAFSKAVILEDNTLYVLIALMIAPSAAQIALSTYSRTRGWKSAAAWLDNTATHLLSFTGLILFFSTGSISIDTYQSVYLWIDIFIVGLCIFFVIKYWQKPILQRYSYSLNIGFPMMMNGVAIFFVTGSSRLLIGTFLGPEALAGYAYIFRVAGTILLIHQFLMTAWAVQIYKDESDKIDRHLMWFGFAISGAGLFVFTLFLIPASSRFFPDFVDLSDITLIGLTLCQVILWSLSASLEPRINRLLKAGRMAFITTIVAMTMVSCVAILTWLQLLEVNGIIFVICCAQAFLILIQLSVGRENGTKGLVMTTRTIFIGPALILFMTFVLEGIL